ncbi:predicted protein [Chaetoceros tenuissimus]|uniref:Uncharacterized protein n=1 Tax=Chaetoceros tenuissimus TaxID=426638 RepID=A0AAD3D736_9STRA|nr:predicted protein [Chaetoceros tenuissimus]
MINLKAMKEHVAKAADAAKNFKGLDQMAANDEYVHTEGLNVKKRPHPTERQRKTQSQESKQKNGKNDSDKKQNHYLLDSVAELMAEKSSRQAMEQEKLQVQETRKQFLDKEANRKQEQRHSLHTMNHDDDDDNSVFSNEGDDPILNMMNGKDATTNTNTTTFSSMQIGTPSKTKKDPNRFMADLDARISKPPTRNHELSIPNTNTDVSNPLAQVSTAFQSFSTSPNKMDWLKQVAPKNIHDTMLPFKIPGIGPDNLNEKECEPLHRRHPEEDDENDEEKVIVTNSTNIMGDQESAELMRIRSRMNQDIFSVGMDLLEKNRYYVWVVVTFFVMILGYLMTKNKTDDGIR